MSLSRNISGPIEQMQRLNAKGEGYWLESIHLSSGITIKRACVCKIGSGWLEIEDEDSGQFIWINTKHIISLNIVEG